MSTLSPHTIAEHIEALMRYYGGMLLLAGLFISGQPLSGASLESPAFQITTDTLDAGGGQNGNRDYANIGSIGGIGGAASVSTSGLENKHGYIGQLFEVTSLTLSATPAAVNEGGITQISSVAGLDDGSFLQVTTGVSWSIYGPIASVSSSGVATAGYVYEGAPAVVLGEYMGSSALVGILVQNVGHDDFGLYANDGLPDEWQVRYFGIDFPGAGPNCDPDNDGSDNLFEYMAGLEPTNRLSQLKFSVTARSGQPRQIRFSPCLPGRTYVLEYVDALGLDRYKPLTEGVVSDNGTERTIVDPGAVHATRFYRLKITLP